MTFDCEDELDKIAEMMPQAELVLRIRCDDPTADISLGMKYGAEAQKEAPELLAAAKRRKLNVIGVSFHVGSGDREPVFFRHAIAAARQVFDAAKTVGYNLPLLDIGGGMLGSFDAQGEVVMGGVAEHVNSALAACFPLPHYKHVKVIAEPGRYFTEVSVTMFAMVHTVKPRPDGRQWYYITDGATRMCMQEFCRRPYQILYRRWHLSCDVDSTTKPFRVQRATGFVATDKVMTCMQ